MKHTFATWLLVFTVGVVGCAESGLGGENNGSDEDMGVDVDTGSPEEDMAPAEDLGAPDEGPPNLVAYEVCVLVNDDPWGECDQDGVLDFGTLSQGWSKTLVARIDNIADRSFFARRTDTGGEPIALETAIYDMEVPPVRTDAPIPFEVVVDGALFVEVTFTAPAEARLFGGNATIFVDAGSDEEQPIAIPYSAQVTACPMGTADCNGDGNCDIDVATNDMHCGQCDFACDLLNASSQCVDGGCEVVTCVDPFDNCDMLDGTGCETDLETDLDHCGGCNAACAFDNATAECDQRTCNFLDCVVNWHNIDDDLSNGCEYECTVQAGLDLPDDMFIDSNCDGIDGDASSAVFVATDGNDAFAGTRDAPVATIAEAIAVVTATSGLTQIYVSEGTYFEQVQLANAVPIYGGYSRAQGWVRTDVAITKFQWSTPASGRIVAMTGANITLPTMIDRIDLEAGGAVANDVDVYGFHCRNCDGVTLRASRIITGTAGDGSNGSSGQTGQQAFGRGYDGGLGASGSCNGSGWGAGGAGGVSDCSARGGAGGRGGTEGDNAGIRGGHGQIGGATNQPGGGGAGGGGGDPGRDGSNGRNGSNGTSPSNGAAGAGGTFVGNYWSGDDGSDGANGSHGMGGGGGGGGGGQGCFFCNDGSGNGGGGGGGGGCGGRRGTGGNAGGSNFGLVLIDSTGFTLVDTTILVGDAGDGGNGGSGGVGSGGGNGRLGHTSCSSEIGEGGDGGDGGDGGNGSHGGGGAGGVVWGVYRSGTAIPLPGSNTIAVGLAGQGGTSSGNDGVNGTATAY